MDRCDNCMKSLRDLDVPRSDATAGLVRSVMEDDLRRLSWEKALTVETEVPVGEVLRLMREAQTGSVLVVEGQRLAGIFTEHDMLCKVAGRDASTFSTPIRELMTPNPETLKETDSVAAALNKMSIGRYRNVPVVRMDGSYAVASIQLVINYIAREDW
jgi:signal-transduction protein with cAMP-binding, CBS, and nucleotidyltransferase domain